MTNHPFVVRTIFKDDKHVVLEDCCGYVVCPASANSSLDDDVHCNHPADHPVHAAVVQQQDVTMAACANCVRLEKAEFLRAIARYAFVVVVFAMLMTRSCSMRELTINGPPRTYGGLARGTRSQWSPKRSAFAGQLGQKLQASLR